MSYANPLMLLGLAGILVPVILHLITQHKAKRVDWGAMQFLLASVVHRSRRTLLEQILLLIVRCLLIALVALALALPFVPPDSRIPWPFVLPTALLAAGSMAAATALGKYPRWRWGLYIASAVLFGMVVVGTVAERMWGINLAPRAGGRDMVIVIDGSESMNLVVDGVSNFQRAIDEAGAVVDSMQRGDTASIAVIGARRQIQPPAPTARIDQLKKILADLKPCGGMMSARDVFSAAAAALARGENVSKRIVVVTDAQAAGWKQQGHVDWDDLSAPLKKLPAMPMIVMRRLPLPQRIDNVQIAEVAVAGAVLGPDRDQAINVSVKNTGTENIRDAFEVELAIDGKATPFRQTVAELQPGASTTLTFFHRFDRGGLHSLEAHLTRRDDLAWDNSSACVVRTYDRLPVLVIEGNPSARARDRSAWFVNLALALEADEPASGKPPAAGQLANAPPRPPRLFDVTKVDFSKLDTIRDLRQYRVVILADVPTLSVGVASGISDMVAAGGGLLVLPGNRCDKTFYDRWQSARGVPVMPATLAERRVADSKRPVVHPLVGSIKHPALKLIGEGAQTDFGTAAINAYWNLKPAANDDTVQVAATLDTGEPLLVERQLGKGRVLMSAVGWDGRSSNLPALQSFLPLVHEVVDHLMHLPASGQQQGQASDLAIELRTAAEEMAVAPTETSAQVGHGLWAQYFIGTDFRQLALERIDADVAFQWANPPINDPKVENFCVRWTGSLTAPRTGKYTFSLDGEQTELWLNGKLVATAIPVTQPVGKAAPANAAPINAAPAVNSIELTAGRPVAVRIEHVARGKQSKCRLLWQEVAAAVQPVPSDWLSPQVAWQMELAGGTNSAGGSSERPASDGSSAAAVVGPSGERSQARLARHENHVVAHLSDISRPGLYRLTLPDSMRDDFRNLLVGDSLPIAIQGMPEESVLAPLAADDLATAQPRVPLTAVDSLDKMLSILSDQRSGHRLWRYLAIAALLLAIGEIALARWIAVQRNVGVMQTVEFAPVSNIRAAFATPTMAKFAGRDSGRETAVK
ncbi:MAG: BatA domain-containing protein [Planctomycetia bacterium]|nr:BatA domain-containing protein [Planctomycetia bacterium]